MQVLRRSTPSVVAALLLHASFAAGQGSTTIPVDDPVYRDIDRLIDVGLVTDVIVGQRPYSRAIVARALRGARVRLAAGMNVETAADSAALERVARLVGALRDDSTATAGTSRSAAIASARLDMLGTDASSRPVPSNGLGFTEADINTLTDNHAGIRYRPGFNAVATTDAYAALGERVSLQARPRLWYRTGRESIDAGAGAELSAVSARGLLGNVAMTIGREYTLWAPEPGAGLFFSANAPAIDMVRVSSDAPFRLPGLLARAGILGATIQVANLGFSAANDHSLMVSYKASLQPTSILELGATFENHFGGAGAHNPSRLARFIDLVPFLDILKHHADSTDFDSDKLLGADARLRMPWAGNVTGYVELALEDFDFHRLGSVFTQDAAYTTGLIIPRLVAPSLSGRVSYHTTGIRFYEHHLVRNGITANRFILGDDLGHDADGFYGDVQWRASRTWALGVGAAGEQRRNDLYIGQYVNPDQTGLVFSITSPQPVERRARASASMQWFAPDGADMIELRGGAERVSNFGYVVGPDRRSFVTALSFVHHW